jgi:prepilin-type N-terminal cleavage/methylation domain-containing protein
MRFFIFKSEKHKQFALMEPKIIERTSKLRHKKGFTLVELLVSVGVIGFLMIAMAALFQPVSNMVFGTRRDARMDSILTSIGDYVRKSTDVSEVIGIYRFNSDPAEPESVELDEALNIFYADGRGYVYALYFCNSGRLFDLGNIESLDIEDFDSLVDEFFADTPIAIQNLQDKAVFNEDYYNNSAILKHRFWKFSERGLRIAHNAYRATNGDVLTNEIGTGQRITRQGITTFNFIHPDFIFKFSEESQDIRMNNFHEINHDAADEFLVINNGEIDVSDEDVYGNETRYDPEDPEEWGIIILYLVR